MAITAKFVADFSEFDKGVQTSVENLRKFEKVAKDAVHPLDQFGARAKVMSSVEMNKVLGNWTSSLQTFDSTLAAAGINIGPVIRAFTEMTAAAGASATGLGLVATAGAVLAGSIAAMKVYQWAFDWLGWSNAINTTSQKLWEQVAAIKGWKSGAAEAAAVQDTLARASQNAGREITNYAEAIEINKKAAEAQSRAFQASIDPARESRKAISEWQKSIRDISQRGDLAALNKDLLSHNFSLQTLATRYNTTVDALEYYRRKLTETSAAEKKAADDRAKAQEKQAADLRKFYNDMGMLEIKAAEDAHAALTKQQADLRAYYNWVGERRMEDDRAAAEAAAKKAADAAAAGQIAMDAAINEHKARVAAAQGTNEHTQAVNLSNQAISQIPGVSGPAITAINLLGREAQTAAQYYDQLKGTIDNAAQTAATLAKWNAPMGGQLGASNVVQIGRNLFSKATGEYLGELEAKYGAGGFLGYGVRGKLAEERVANVNIYGSVLGTPQEIARVVGGALTNSYSSGGNRLPV